MFFVHNLRVVTLGPRPALTIRITCRKHFLSYTNYAIFFVAFLHNLQSKSGDSPSTHQRSCRHPQPYLDLPRISVCSMWDTSKREALLLVNRCELTMLRSLYCTGRRNPPKFTIFPPFSTWKSNRAVPSAFTSAESALLRAGTMGFLRTLDENIVSPFWIAPAVTELSFCCFVLSRRPMSTDNRVKSAQSAIRFSFGVQMGAERFQSHFMVILLPQIMHESMKIINII